MAKVTITPREITPVYQPGVGWVGCSKCHGLRHCFCEEIAADEAATGGCQTCDDDQVIVTCTECEGGEVWDEDGCETCPACQGAYSIPCPACE